MNNAIITILASGSVAAFLSALVSYLLQSWISTRLKEAIGHEYAQKLETHKANLRAEHDIHLEQLRADLRDIAGERQIKFTHLHEKTVDTVADTFAALQKLHSAVANYVSVMGTSEQPPMEERRERVNEALKQLDEKFRPRQIFLPKKTATAIADLSDKLFNRARDFHSKVESADDSNTKAWSEIASYVEQEVPKLLDDLAGEIRRLLGRQGDE